MSDEIRPRFVSLPFVSVVSEGTRGFSRDPQEHLRMDGSLAHVMSLRIAAVLSLATSPVSVAASSPAPSQEKHSSTDAEHLVCRLTKAHPVASGAPVVINAIEEPDFFQALGRHESHGDIIYVSGSAHGTCYFAAGSNLKKVRPAPRASRSPQNAPSP